MSNCKPKLWSNGVVEGGFIRDNLHEQIQELDKKISLLSGNSNDEFINQIENDIKNVEYEILQNKELISINDKDIDNIKVDIQNIIDNMPTDLSNELELLETKINNTINQHISDFNSLNGKISALENASPDSGLNLDQIIETQPYKNTTDELAELMSVDKNKVVNFTIRELLENSAYAIGTGSDLYGITNTKISDIEARLSVLENPSPESSNTSSSGSSSGGGLTLDQTIEVHPYQGISDELASKTGVTDKNIAVPLPVSTLLEMAATGSSGAADLSMVYKPKIEDHETRLSTLESKDFLDKEFIAKPFQMASDELLDSTGFTRDKEYTRTYKQWIENYAETQCMNMEMYWIDKPKIADHETRLTTIEGKRTLDDRGTMSYSGSGFSYISYSNERYIDIMADFLKRISKFNYQINNTILPDISTIKERLTALEG